MNKLADGIHRPRLTYAHPIVYMPAEPDQELIDKLTTRRDKWRAEAEYWQQIAAGRKTKIRQLKNDLRTREHQVGIAG